MGKATSCTQNRNTIWSLFFALYWLLKLSRNMGDKIRPKSKHYKVYGNDLCLSLTLGRLASIEFTSRLVFIKLVLTIEDDLLKSPFMV